MSQTICFDAELCSKSKHKVPFWRLKLCWHDRLKHIILKVGTTHLCKYILYWLAYKWVYKHHHITRSSFRIPLKDITFKKKIYLMYKSVYYRPNSAMLSRRVKQSIELVLWQHQDMHLFSESSHQKLVVGLQRSVAATCAGTFSQSPNLIVGRLFSQVKIASQNDVELPGKMSDRSLSSLHDWSRMVY